MIKGVSLFVLSLIFVGTGLNANKAAIVYKVNKIQKEIEKRRVTRLYLKKILIELDELKREAGMCSMGVYHRIASIENNLIMSYR